MGMRSTAHNSIFRRFRYREVIRAQYFSKSSFQSRFSNGDVGSDSQQSDKMQGYDEKAELVKSGPR